MLNEVKFSKFVDTNEHTDSIDLDDFIRRNYILFFIQIYNIDIYEKIKVYINHRPAFGLDPYQIYHSFKLLNSKFDSDDNNVNLPRHLFLNELQTRGNYFNNFKLNY